MDNALEGEQMKLNIPMVSPSRMAQNFISKCSQSCQSSLIPGTEMSVLRAKGNPGLVYFASFV